MDQQQIEQLEAVLEVALRLEDRQEIAIARVNLAAALLHVDEARAYEEVEEALSAVRRARYQRGEMFLGLNFATGFLDRGDIQRARNLAERAVELAPEEEPMHYLLARLNLARIYTEGFDLSAQSSDCLREALAMINEVTEADPQQATEFITQLELPLSQAVQAAMQSGDLDLALDVMRLINPGEVAALEQQQRARSWQPDIEVLKARQDVALDEYLGTWRGFRTAGRLAHLDELPALISDYATTAAELFFWDDDSAASSPATLELPGQPPSANGPAGWLELAKRVGGGDIDIGEAVELAEELAVGDDDVMLLVTVTGKHPDYGGATGYAAMELAGRSMKSDAAAAKLLRMIAAVNKDTMSSKASLEMADDRLTEGVNDVLRAEVLNELAVNSLERGEMEEAVSYAASAFELATQCGAMDIAMMAQGNLANVFMRAGQLREALAILEPLAEYQKEAGDTRGLEITEFNIRGVRDALERQRGD